MYVHLPEANFGKLRIWRPTEVLYRYDANLKLKVLEKKS
jgi:hypothetical protein